MKQEVRKDKLKPHKVIERVFAHAFEGIKFGNKIFCVSIYVFSSSILRLFQHLLNFA